LAQLNDSVKEKLPFEHQQNFAMIEATLNLEEVLSRLRLLTEALANTDQKIDGFTSEQANALDGEICKAIAAVLRTGNVNIESHERFARWLAQSRYTRPVEVVTTNYDLLIEKGFEAVGTPYFDGFVGTYSGTFRPDLVEDDLSLENIRVPSGWIRLWKLHGSVSWVIDSTKGPKLIRRLGAESIPESQRPLAIYPSFQKYEESRRFPFVTLADRLRRALAVPESLVITCGYSFSDQHINELLFDGAQFYPGSEVIALFFENIPSDVSARAQRLRNLTALGASEAVISGQIGSWDDQEGETEFFKVRRFLIGDFAVLSNFLSNRIAGTPL